METKKIKEKWFVSRTEHFKGKHLNTDVRVFKTRASAQNYFKKLFAKACEIETLLSGNPTNGVDSWGDDVDSCIWLHHAGFSKCEIFIDIDCCIEHNKIKEQSERS